MLVCVVLLSLFPGITQGQCSDGLDNDNDGLTDYPLDLGCSSPTDPDETDPAPAVACNDGLDNDNDGLIDHPLDPGCSSLTDPDETNPAPTVACNDGLDNDNDGLIDHPLDPGCSSPTDPDEVNSRSTQCSDGVDNDADGAVDYPADSSCSGHSDDSEGDWSPSCRLFRQVELRKTVRFDEQNLDPDAFDVSDCGPNCREYRIGKDGDNYLSAGGPNSCGTSVNTARFIVNRPDLIQRVTLSSVRYDDFLSIRVNNQLVWSDPAGWMGGVSGKPACVENRRAGFRGTVDLTHFFTGTAPGGTVQFEQTIYYRAKGEGFSRLRSYRVGSDRCVLSENISGNCSSLEGDSRCTLQEEVVDGVTPWDQSRATGRSQDPSERSFSNTEGCTLLVTRPWWEKERTYSCTGGRSGKVGLPECADGDDNDGDGNVDYPNDDGCGSYGDPSEDSEGCTQTGSCVCGSDSDADGLVDVRSEVAICQNLSGRLVCPTDRQQCTRQYFSVWDPSGFGAVEQRQDWVCPAGVEYGCGRDSTDGNVYCSSRPCVNALAPLTEEHDSAGDW